MPFFFPPAEWLDVTASLSLPLAAVVGVALDRLLGETPRWHPLVGFGKLADAIERGGNRGHGVWRRIGGVGAWVLAVVPWVALAGCARGQAPRVVGWLIDVLLLYLALGGRSLTEHAERVAADLAAGDLAAAREHVGWIVSRDTADLDESGIARACVESTLENGSDAVFGALFWFALLGGTGAVLFRLSNTLDAMWGYKSERFLCFGWAAARIDDLLNYLPARLTALSYALCGNRTRVKFRAALRCWRRQAPQWESPNAGPVMSAGAGSLGLALGGPAIYHGQIEKRPLLGKGRAARGGDIARALSLVRRGVALWLAVFLAIGVLGELNA
ncbi:MAG: adenosylcobinamide-phosphate synthase CbiB [Candidatus Accumulibacter sp.]|jgi:adenosylcobinamide-phosphate synthase|nr:adenosylcobinamide-phosphate synthase CbiB [Accumulibacter sp.]